MTEQRNYEKDLPMRPPEGLQAWLKGKGYLQKHLLIYKAAYWTDPITEMKEKVVQLRCSSCGGTCYQERAENKSQYTGAPFGFSIAK